MSAAQEYLQWRVSEYGRGYTAARHIPKGTTFCVYDGTIALTTRRSNHRVSLGPIASFGYSVELDGSETVQGSADSSLGLLQLANHSCNPNCRIDPIDTPSGIPLLILRAMRDIPPGEEITIDYDEQASPASKLAGLTFWQWQPPKSPKCAPGMKRIQCGCAGPGQRCPN